MNPDKIVDKYLHYELDDAQAYMLAKRWLLKNEPRLPAPKNVLILDADIPGIHEFLLAQLRSRPSAGFLGPMVRGYERDEEVRQTAIAYVHDHVADPTTAAVIYWLLSAASLSAEERTTLLTLANQHFQLAPIRNQYGVNLLCRLLSDKNEHYENLYGLAANWLKNNPPARMAQSLLTFFIEQDPEEFIPFGLQFIEQYKNESISIYPLGAIILSGYSESERIVKAWLSGNHTPQSLGFVIAIYFRDRELTAHKRELIRNLMKQAPDIQVVVLTALLENSEHPSIFRFARAWISRHKDHASITGLLKSLISAASPNDEKTILLLKNLLLIRKFDKALLSVPPDQITWEKTLVSASRKFKDPELNEIAQHLLS